MPAHDGCRMSAFSVNPSFPSRSGARSKHSIGGVPVTVLHTYPRDGTEALPARAGAERTRMCGGRFGKDAGRSRKKGRATVRRTPQRTVERPASSDRCSTPFGRVSPLLPNYELNIGMINARRDVHSCLRRSLDFFYRIRIPSTCCERLLPRRPSLCVFVRVCV